MGWLAHLPLALGAIGALAAMGIPRVLWTTLGAFVLLGAAGYAWQGSPTLAASPVAADRERMPPDPGYKQLRDMFFGRFGGESMYFGLADAALSSGNTWMAVRVLSGGVQYAPRNVGLWTELGNAIALHDEGAVSPASLLAYRQAMQVAPTHPGPPFFLSMAYFRARDLVQARFWMARALALTPKDASYRDEIVGRLELIDAWIAAVERIQARERAGAALRR